MEHFKIIQVFQDNSALAEKCDSISDKYCSFPRCFTNASARS